MFKKSIVPFFFHLDRFIHKPLRVLYLSLAFLLLSLVVDGTLWNMWQLSREISSSESRIVELNKETKILEKNIKNSQLPEFIEKEARRRFELAAEGDLVFVFPPTKNPSPLKQN